MSEDESAHPVKSPDTHEPAADNEQFACNEPAARTESGISETAGIPGTGSETGSGTSTLTTAQMPKMLLRFLRAMVCGTGVTARFVYGSHEHSRYTVQLKGPWPALLQRLHAEAKAVSTSDVYPAIPASLPFEEAFRDIFAWPSVLLKLQTAAQADRDEEECHGLVTEKCPEISPRFLMGMTIVGIRLSFMEWLDDSISLYQLYKSRSPLVCRRLYDETSDALIKMWTRAGVIHCDMHLNNVLVSRQTGRVRIIDYGMAIRLNEAMREELSRAVSEDRLPPAKAFALVCKQHAAKTLLKRGYELNEDEDWNDDGSFLRILKSCITKCAKKLVALPNDE